MEHYYEIDSSSKRDVWLHDALQKMSFEQLDVFFSAVKNLVYGPCSGHRAIYSTFGIDRSFFFFQTNRIEKKLRIAFQYDSTAYSVYSVLDDFLFSLMFMACDGWRNKFLKSVKMRMRYEKTTKKISNKFKHAVFRSWLSLVEDDSVIVPVDKMFGKRGFLVLFRQMRYFYYERLADDSLPLLFFGMVSIVSLFLVSIIWHSL